MVISNEKAPGPSSVRVPASQYAVYAGAFVLLVAFCALTYGRVPEAVPLHLGANGVDRWGSKGVALMVFPVVMYLFLASLFLFIQISFAKAVEEHFGGHAEALTFERVGAHRFLQRCWCASGAAFSFAISFGLAASYAEFVSLETFCVLVVLVSGFLVIPFLIPLRKVSGLFPSFQGDVSICDDSYWHGGGSFYSNPNDERTFVPKRFPGIGYTVNLAHVRVKVGMMLFVLYIVAFMAICVIFF